MTTVPERPPFLKTDSRGFVDARGRIDVTVDVGPGGDLVFRPEKLLLGTGTIVTWVWRSSVHNIRVESQPDGADWRGTAGSPSKSYETGHTHRHVFAEKGTYEYYCTRHGSAGMTGTIVVD